MCVLGRGSGGGQQLCLKKWGALQVFCLYSKTWVAQGVTNLQESSVNELDWLKGRWWCTARRLTFRPWLQSLSARLVVAGNPSKEAFVQHSSDPLLVPSGLVPDSIEKITCSRESLLLGSRTRWFFWLPSEDPSPWVPPVFLENWFLHYSMLPKAACPGIRFQGTLSYCDKPAHHPLSPTQVPHFVGGVDE